MVNIIKDIDLITQIKNYDVILVGTNTYHTMGNGFQLKIRKKYPEVYKMNISTKYGDKSKIGTRITNNGSPKFSLCFITNSYNFRPDLSPDYLDYEGLENCIKTANIEFKDLNVATTMIGCSKFDGNGDKNKVIDILNKYSDRMNLFIYDYEQLSRETESAIKYLEIVNNEDYDRKKKLELLNKLDKDNSEPMNVNTKKLKKIKEDIKALLKNE